MLAMVVALHVRQDCCQNHSKWSRIVKNIKALPTLTR